MALFTSMQAVKAVKAASAGKAENFLQKTVDMSWKMWYNENVERGWKNERVLSEDRALQLVSYGST